VAKKAARKRRAPAAEEDATEHTTPALDRIAALLGLFVVKDMEADEASVKLGNVGFSDREIAALIGVTAGYVRLARFRAKKKGGRKPRKKKAA
jgi:DNA-directed RNA polymerase specialized sigma24 family protein